MSFDWRELLSLAKVLLDQRGSLPSEEATLRSVVSRSYFAAFCYASQVAGVRYGFAPTRTAEDHGRLKAHFRGKGMFGIVSKLDDLRKWRNLCDYDDITTV